MIQWEHPCAEFLSETNQTCKQCQTLQMASSSSQRRTSIEDQSKHVCIAQQPCNNSSAHSPHPRTVCRCLVAHEILGSHLLQRYSLLDQLAVSCTTVSFLQSRALGPTKWHKTLESRITKPKQANNWTWKSSGLSGYFFSIDSRFCLFTLRKPGTMNTTSAGIFQLFVCPST